MNNNLQNYRNWFPLFAILLFVAQSCGPVRLISEYDPITDEKVTELEEKVTTFFVKLERVVGTNHADYEHFTNFYDEVKVDLNTLKVRADAVDKNRIVREQIEELSNMVESLEELHKMGFATIEQVRPLQQSFNSAFTAIIKFQMALKRGEKTK
ncbi:hypothetical protein QWY93_07410 [Echinicola jeungdonensis]|uniref:Uncharacterized protein n=1 Tax=Echinicola jeungdonensis TaxID=709343 RepID=A0ABV5J792_9BACT|nr:hypothetical protein [Echinicola jeungdonensis]MDN3669152.1 hypothetical protein [Echinicola jeungdonensis]